MTDHLYASLGWLPAAPADFSAQCRALVKSGADTQGADIGKQLRRLATYALDENQLIRLGKSIAAARSNGSSLAPLTPLRLGVIGNGTLDHLALPLVGSAARHGVALDYMLGHY